MKGKRTKDLTEKALLQETWLPGKMSKCFPLAGRDWHIELGQLNSSGKTWNKSYIHIHSYIHTEKERVRAREREKTCWQRRCKCTILSLWIMQKANMSWFFPVLPSKLELVRHWYNCNYVLHFVAGRADQLFP